MKIEELFEEWEKDCHIDKTELGDESIRIAKLHSKYLKWMFEERLRLKKMDAEFKQLKLEKYEFYTQGPTKEQKDKGWELPSKGIILKQDLNMYMDADKDVIDYSLKIGLQQEKAQLLEDIIKSLNNRGYNISAAITWAKFTMGG
jgi:hypothetical protein